MNCLEDATGQFAPLCREIYYFQWLAWSNKWFSTVLRTLVCGVQWRYKDAEAKVDSFFCMSQIKIRYIIMSEGDRWCTTNVLWAVV